MTDSKPSIKNLFNEADRALKSGNKEKAHKLFNELIKLKSSDWLEQHYIGVAYFLLDRKEEALREFQTAIDNYRQDPSLFYTYHYKGVTLFDLGRKAEALAGC